MSLYEPQLFMCEEHTHTLISPTPNPASALSSLLPSMPPELVDLTADDDNSPPASPKTPRPAAIFRSALWCGAAGSASAPPVMQNEPPPSPELRPVFKRLRFSAEPPRSMCNHFRSPDPPSPPHHQPALSRRSSEDSYRRLPRTSTPSRVQLTDAEHRVLMRMDSSSSSTSMMMMMAMNNSLGGRGSTSSPGPRSLLSERAPPHPMALPPHHPMLMPPTLIRQGSSPMPAVLPPPPPAPAADSLPVVPRPLPLQMPSNALVPSAAAHQLHHHPAALAHHHHAMVVPYYDHNPVDPSYEPQVVVPETLRLFPEERPFFPLTSDRAAGSTSNADVDQVELNLDLELSL